jgi:hypothetical protein
MSRKNKIRVGRHYLPLQFDLLAMPAVIRVKKGDVLTGRCRPPVITRTAWPGIAPVSNDLDPSWRVPSLQLAKFIDRCVATMVIDKDDLLRKNGLGGHRFDRPLDGVRTPEAWDNHTHWSV